MAKFLKFILCISPAREERGTSAMKLYGSFGGIETRFSEQNRVSLRPKEWQSGWWDSKTKGQLLREVQPIWTNVSGEKMSHKEYFDVLDKLGPPEPPERGISLQEVVVTKVPPEPMPQETVVIAEEEKTTQSQSLESESSNLSTDSAGRGLASLAGRLARYHGLRRFVRGLSNDRLLFVRTFSARLASRSSRHSSIMDNPFMAATNDQIYMMANGENVSSSKSENLETSEHPCLLSRKLVTKFDSSDRVIGRKMPDHDPNCLCQDSSVTWLISLNPIKALPESTDNEISTSSVYALPSKSYVAIDNMSSTTPVCSDDLSYNPYSTTIAKEESAVKNDGVKSITSKSSSKITTSERIDSKSPFASVETGNIRKIANLSGFVNASNSVYNPAGFSTCSIASASRISSLSGYGINNPSVICNRMERDTSAFKSLTAFCGSKLITEEPLEKSYQQTDETVISKPLITFTPDNSFQDAQNDSCLPLDAQNDSCLPLDALDLTSYPLETRPVENVFEESDLVYLTLIIKGQVVSVYRSQMSTNDITVEKPFSSSKREDTVTKVVTKEVSCETTTSNLTHQFSHKNNGVTRNIPYCSELVDRSVSAMPLNKGSQGNIKPRVSYSRAEANAKMDEILRMLGTVENLLQKVVLPRINHESPTKETMTHAVIQQGSILNYSGAGDDGVVSQIGQRECKNIEKWVRDDLSAQSGLFQSETIHISDCAAPYSEKISNMGSSLQRSPSLENVSSIFEDMKKPFKFTQAKCMVDEKSPCVGSYNLLDLAQDEHDFSECNTGVKLLPKIHLSDTRNCQDVLAANKGITGKNCLEFTCPNEDILGCIERGLLQTLSSSEKEPEDTVVKEIVLQEQNK